MRNLRHACDNLEIIYSDLRLLADLVITSFPKRWDYTHERHSLLDGIRKRVEYLNVDRGLHPDRLVTEILNACAEFQPTLNIEERSFTWTDAFDDEILSVVSKTRCFQSQHRDWDCLFNHLQIYIIVFNGC